MSLSFRNTPLFISDFSPISTFYMAVKFIPVLLPEFCQPDETMLFGRRLVQITKELKIALPSITGTPIMAFPEACHYRIKVHIPGRTFGSL